MDSVSELLGCRLVSDLTLVVFTTVLVKVNLRLSPDSPVTLTIFASTRQTHRRCNENTCSTAEEETYRHLNHRSSQMLVLHWLDWGWLLLMNTFIAMVITQIRKAWKAKHVLLFFFFPWGCFYIHRTFSKLNSSPNIWTKPPGRSLVQNLSFLQLFCVMIWFFIKSPLQCSHHLLTLTSMYYHMVTAVYYESKQLLNFLPCMLRNCSSSSSTSLLFWNVLRYGVYVFQF